MSTYGIHYRHSAFNSLVLLLCLQGVLTGFKGELLHVFNKNENAIHKSEYFDTIAHRDSIILMGDSLGDLHMADGAGECTNLLKIGFLNDKVRLLFMVTDMV